MDVVVKHMSGNISPVTAVDYIISDSVCIIDLSEMLMNIG